MTLSKHFRYELYVARQTATGSRVRQTRMPSGSWQKRYYELFFTGYAIGRCAGRSPWLIGVAVVVLGAILVGVTMALVG